MQNSESHMMCCLGHEEFKKPFTSLESSHGEAWLDMLSVNLESYKLMDVNINTNPTEDTILVVLS